MTLDYLKSILLNGYKCTNCTDCLIDPISIILSISQLEQENISLYSHYALVNHAIYTQLFTVYKLNCSERNLPASFFSESGINSSSCDSLRTSSDNLKSSKRNRTRNRTASKEKLNKSNSLSRFRTNQSFLNTIHVSILPL